MNQNYFEKIINFSNEFNFIEINGSNQLTKTFKVIDNQTNKNYFYKQIHKKNFDEYKLITLVIENLNNHNFPTPKLHYHSHQKNELISHLIFEFLQNEKIILNNINTELTYNNKCLESLKLIEKFHQITKKIPKNQINQLNLQRIQLTNKINTKFFSLQNNLKTQFKTELEFKYPNEQIIINDVNPSNFIINNNKLYLIDFDDIRIGNYEYDLSKFFVNLYYETSNIKKTFENFTNVLKTYELKKIDKKLLINSIKLNFLDKTYTSFLQTKKLNTNLTNKLIEIKTNEKTYFEILNNNLK